MKFCICLFFTIITITAISQSSLSYSAVLKNTSGEKVDVKTIQNSGKPLILDFWASWCKPCIVKYNSLKDVYKTWQEETGVRIVSISIDNEKGAEKAREIAQKNGWPFDLYFDTENKLMGQLTSERSVPHTFFFDKNLKLVTDKMGANIQLKNTKGGEDKAFQEMYTKNKPLEEFECDLTEYYKILKGLKN